jgi:hypothetical protein
LKYLLYGAVAKVSTEPDKVGVIAVDPDVNYQTIKLVQVDAA